MKKYIKSYGFVFIFILIYFVSQQIILAFAQFGLMIKYFIENRVNTEEAISYVTTNSVYLSIIPIIISIFIFFFIVYLRKEKYTEVFLFKKLNSENYVIMLVLAISLLFVVEYLVILLQNSGLLGNNINEFNKITEEIMSGDNLFLLILAVGIIGPIGEELLFRGIVLTELRKIHNTATAVVLQALLFGLIHMIAVQVIYAAFIGIFLGFVAVKTQSIWAPIIMHIINNTLSVLFSKEVLRIPALENLKSDLIILIPAILITLLVVLYIWIDPFKRYKRYSSSIQL